MCLCTNKKQKLNLNTLFHGNNILWGEKHSSVTLGQEPPDALMLGGRNEANSRRERGLTQDMVLSVNYFMAERMKTYRKTDGGAQTRPLGDRRRVKKMELDSKTIYIYRERVNLKVNL